MFGPHRCRNTRVPLPRRRGSSFYWNKCKRLLAARRTLQAVARRAGRQALTRHPHEMEATRLPNTFMMHACMSRLNQGWVLLSGFAQT